MDTYRCDMRRFIYLAHAKRSGAHLLITSRLCRPTIGIRQLSHIDRHDRSPKVDYSQITKTDRIASSKIYIGTNALRLLSFHSVNGIKYGTDFIVSNIIRAKEFNQRVLPARLLIVPFSNVVHKSVVVLKDCAILINKTFDSFLRAIVYIGKEVGKLAGVGIIICFKMARYIITDKYSLKDFLPATQDSINYFCKCTISEGFLIIEALDYALTSVFGATTDYFLQTIEHCFGENVKDISVELSTMSKETFEFYKKVKLFKLRNLKTKVVRAAIKETRDTIIKEIKKD